MTTTFQGLLNMQFNYAHFSGALAIERGSVNTERKGSGAVNKTID